jgi:hypothetical protein
MNNYIVYYKAQFNKKWKTFTKLVEANSIEDAKRKADIWEKLIIKTERV